MNSVHSFENTRWSTAEQKIEYRHRAALDLIPEDSTSLLDIGCGEGVFLSLVREKFPSSTLSGGDLSEVALSRVKERNANIELSLIDANGQLPYKDNSFDVVSVLDVLEHTLEPEKMIAEIKRVTKRYIILSVPNFSSLPARLQTVLGLVPENNKPNKGHMYWFNYNVLRTLLKEHDLKIVKILSNQQLQNKPYIGKIIQTGKSIFPNLFALSFVVLVNKADALKSRGDL